MHVTVRYHALLREKTGLASEAFELNSTTPRVADVLTAFVARHGAFERLAPSLHIAINDEIVRRDQTINENDTIDLMPPFGGG